MKSMVMTMLFCIPLSVFSQTSMTYIIGKDMSISPTPTPVKCGSIKFTIDAVFKGKKLDIYDKVNKVPIINNKYLGKEISKDNSGKGTYTITIENHKVKECTDQDCGNVPDTFTVRLNNKSYGQFVLVPISQADGSSLASTQSLASTPDPESKLGSSILYDALYINKNYKSNTNLGTIITLLDTFYNVKSTNIDSNHFLSTVMKDLYSKGTNESGEILSTAISSVGGFDITTIADGFSKFIVKRTEQELSTAFFDNFQTELNKYPDMQSIFPQTYNVLSAIGKEIYMYEAYIQTLRESFKIDLASLPSNLPKVIDNHKEYFDKNTMLKSELLTAFYVAQGIQNKQHPGKIIENYPINYLETQNLNVKASFQTLQLFSTSLRSNNDTTYWASYSDIKKLFNDMTLLKIYLGLVLQKVRENAILFLDKKCDTVYLAKEMNDSYINLSPYKIFISDLATKTQTLETKITGLKKVSSDSLLFENYYSVISSSIDLMRYAVQIDKLPFLEKDSLKIEDKTKPYFDLAQAAADIVIDVNRRNYSSAIVNGVFILNKMFDSANIKMANEIKNKYPDLCEKQREDLYNNDSAKIIEFITKENPKLNTKEIDSSAADSVCIGKFIAKTYPKLNEKERKELNRDLRTKYFICFNGSSTISICLFKYGSFMAAVAQAKSSDDVESAIEAIALPAGSSSIKRKSKFNVSLNAYCGLFIGHEIEYPYWWKSNAYSFGVTAPIGIAVSWGGNASFSLFASIIDLGAITAFRFSDDTATVAKIEFKDIVSPGFLISLGIPKCPISLNAGCQLTPLLTSVSSSGNSSETSTFRFSLSGCVDIPILNLYTVSKE